MKKVVLKLDLHDDKAKQKAMKAVSRIPGIESIAIDMKDNKLTVVGDVDPIDVVKKLTKNHWCAEILTLRKKLWYAEILTVGPAKEKEEKKPEDDKKKNPNERQLAKRGGVYDEFEGVLGARAEENPCVIS